MSEVSGVNPVAFSDEEKATFLKALEAKLPRFFGSLEGCNWAQLVTCCSWLLASAFALHPEACESHFALLLHFAPMVEEAFEAMFARDPEGAAEAMGRDLVMLPFPQAPSGEGLDFGRLAGKTVH